MNLSTCYTPTANSRKDTVTRKIRNAETGNWETVALSCPVPIQEYNKYMGGVDQHDYLRSSYSLQRMSSKWWLYFAWFGIDVALVNAYILCRAGNQKISHKTFQLKVRDFYFIKSLHLKYHPLCCKGS
jgi:hypothetical protein